MPTVRSELTGARELVKHLGFGATRRFLILAKRIIDMRMQLVITGIRDNQTDYFRYEYPDPDHENGALAQGLWASDAKRYGTTVSAEGGWAHPHGPVLEWGPNKSSWEIIPKQAKALRFFKTYGKQVPGGDPGSIVYAKKVTHTWDPTQLRPHWGPEIIKQEPFLASDLADAMEAAVLQR